MHIFDSRFPLAAKARRQEADAPVSEYRMLQQRLGLERVVVVQPTAYGRDNRCTLEAIAELGQVARGIAVVDTAVTDAELEALTRGGIRGVRFRMLDQPELPWEMLEEMAARIAGFGWHIQFQMDGRDLATRAPLLASLASEVVIEHIGKFLEPVGVDHPGFVALLELLDSGRAWVKLSGAYMTSRSGPPRYEDVSVLARALVRHAPERMVWASNWPHPIAAHGGETPDDQQLLALLADWAPDRAVRDCTLAANPARLYRFG